MLTSDDIMEGSANDLAAQERRPWCDRELAADFDHKLRLSDFHVLIGTSVPRH
jgi:hypothetical protein